MESNTNDYEVKVVNTLKNGNGAYWTISGISRITGIDDLEILKNALNNSKLTSTFKDNSGRDLYFYNEEKSKRLRKKILDLTKLLSW